MIHARWMLFPEGVALREPREVVKVASPYRESRGWRDPHFYVGLGR